jgi:hypothetical protein
MGEYSPGTLMKGASGPSGQQGRDHQANHDHHPVANVLDELGRRHGGIVRRCAALRVAER